MATNTNRYAPDYGVPPGWVLEERLEVQGISHTEIIAGKASLEPETALQFEKVLGVDASIWLEIESDYNFATQRARGSGLRR